MFWRKKALTPEQLLINSLAASDLSEALRLLDGGASPNACDSSGVPAIAIVASARWLTAVQALVDHGADVNVIVRAKDRGIPDAPVLILPSANGAVLVVEALVKAGARVNAADATGLTPLMSASYQGHTNVVAFLVAHGAQLEQADERGYTALMFASNAGQTEMVRALLAVGANPHTTDKQASTPIMFAAQHGHYQVVQELLQAGADPSVRGSHGLSAVGLARQNRHTATLELLGRNEGT